ncbi:MAG: DUF2971 domain-containing protein [Lachnospiraceae bacterium]|nr:DUF2971 domain-containing protein [Lachnospiraceae bacterium]
MKLYRYIPFYRFEEMCKESALSFVNPFTNWDDKKEGFLYRLAKEDIGEIESYLKNKKYGEQQMKQLINGGLFKGESDCEQSWFSMRCQSWCKSENSRYMWEEYGKEDGVCIAVDSSLLCRLEYNGHKVEGFDVQYVEERNPKKEIDMLRGKCGEFYFAKVLQYKDREPYSKENEYRLYVVLLDENGNPQDGIDNIIKIPIKNELDSFFHKIYICPKANSEVYDKLVDKCSEYKIDISKIDKGISGAHFCKDL